MYKHPYTFWSLWPELSLLYRLFVVILTAVTIYSLISATVVLKRVRALKHCPIEGTSADLERQVSVLHNRCAHLRQILGAMFYLFGFLFFVGLQNAPVTLGDGPELPLIEILGSFVFHFVFAANVFFVFLVLHVVQWLVSARLEAVTQNTSN
jgi:hypothetical protein